MQEKPDPPSGLVQGMERASQGFMRQFHVRPGFQACKKDVGLPGLTFAPSRRC